MDGPVTLPKLKHEPWDEEADRRMPPVSREYSEIYSAPTYRFASSDDHRASSSSRRRVEHLESPALLKLKPDPQWDFRADEHPRLPPITRDHPYSHSYLPSTAYRSDSAARLETGSLTAPGTLPRTSHSRDVSYDPDPWTPYAHDRAKPSLWAERDPHAGWSDSYGGYDGHPARPRSPPPLYPSTSSIPSPPDSNAYALRPTPRHRPWSPPPYPPASTVAPPPTHTPPTTTASATGADANTKSCSHCGTGTTPLWRRDPSTQRPLCNACGLYQHQHKMLRPQALIDADRDSDGDDGDALARIPDAEYTGPQCSHCGTRRTSVWRRSKEGAQVCNACGVYARMRGRDRPLSLKKKKIKPRTRLVQPVQK
ncbi:unnamed protein product [Mycena citricolor]|uniref:GATA-type domain-containing protein n=1 Tax=Mycena citricolor TaxID=2018698 RepID=A0AAD2HLB7_9AGAR|nr:unnamed protein product [Mycena citricolor]